MIYTRCQKSLPTRRYVYRFCSEFTKHELKLQTFLLSQNTQGEENSEVDEDLHIVEEIKTNVETKKRVLEVKGEVSRF